MRSNKKKINELNIWPGFVDVLATLLIVTIFTILVSGIAQIYFNDVLGKKTTKISELDLKLAEISEKLSLQITSNKNLKNSNMELKNFLNLEKDKNLEIVSKLKKRELQIKINEKKILELTDNNLELLENVRKKNNSISDLKLENKNKSNKITENLELINKLEKNITLMYEKISILSDQLDEVESRDKKNKVIIKSLGEKLNQALAGKVQELSEYQSIFLKKVKESIGNRSDIIISGDRFIFPSEIFFKSASDELVLEGNNELKKIAQSLLEISSIIPKDIDWVLRIDGHTDKRPISNNKFASNWHLSSSRAIKIVDILISEGLPPKRLIAAGFGEYSPLINENTELAYQKNRRIEIKLTNR